ncbi:hypothetical protein LXL04_008995 [Taraxacum kok-saghyz]
MVSGSRLEGGNGAQNLSASVRRTIQSIKEIVGDHSDADIYSALKETNMDPNETTQKLLNQDPFHEVKRKRDKKKEVIPVKPPVPIKPRKPTEQLVQEIKPNTYIDRNPRRPVFNRINAPDTRVSRQFRVVRDNRHRETKPPANTSVSVPTKDPQNVSEKSSLETCKNLGHNSSEQETVPLDPLSKHVKNVVSSSGKRPLVSNVAPPVQSTKTHDSHVTSPNSSVVGVYSSSSDPVHIPSLASRPSPNVGAIKREVGAVGVRRHSHTSENSQGQFRSFPPSPAVSKTDQNQPSHSNVSESVPNVSSGRPVSNQYNSSRPHSHSHSHQHQQLVTHQKATQANKEWKPKSSQKPSVVEVGVIGTPKKTVPTLTNNPKELTTEDKLPKSTTTHEGQNVILAAHIRVSESDRIRLTFGSLGIEDSPQTSGFQDAEESHAEHMPSLSASSPVPSDDPSGGTQPELVEELVPGSGSGSISPVSEHQPNQRLESSSSPQNMENYTNIRLVRQEPHQQQPPSDLPTFSAYDPQTGYDISYFRPGSDESLRGQVLQVPQEGFSSHVANNSIPATTIPMVQQQQVAQMYPQVHLPHFANLMPYRQFLSPVYVPPMVMPGYSNNPTYSPHPHPHPSSGSSYLLMPGVNPPPHVTKYAIPQYKSLQAGSPTGFGNFTAPNGYALNTPGVVGSASGIDDSARLKYKDGNVYVPNPQAETSELWMNPREMHYNMGGQGAYHGAGQSSHVQFPGMYQAGAHHMGANVAAGAPGTQVAGYQQPQLSQLSWTGNF